MKQWKDLQSSAQLQQLMEDSHKKPVAIFKHSTRCGISHGAKHALESAWDFSEQELDFYYLDLLQFRPISNAVADMLKVTHQSPQVILIYQGKPIYSASHQAISTGGIRKALPKTAHA